jgi:hypothetical protein
MLHAERCARAVPAYPGDEVCNHLLEQALLHVDWVWVCDAMKAGEELVESLHGLLVCLGRVGVGHNLDLFGL